MQYQGIITWIGNVEKVGSRQLEKRTVVVEEDSNHEYKGGLAFDLRGEKVHLIDEYKVGDLIKISLNIKAREYNGRRYNSVSAWKIEGNIGAGSTGGSQENQKNNSLDDDMVHDDLPF